MTDFYWNRAARLPWVSLTEEERAAGWPAALTLENFASMQFTMDGDESARRTARKRRAALLATLREAIAAGQLSAEERRSEVQREVDDGRLFEPIPLASSPRGWFERAQRAAPRRTVTETEVRHAITREAAAEFLAGQGIEPSEHIRAWLRPLELAEEAHQGETGATAKPKRETQADRVARWLTECERRAAELGEPFDRERMPGTKRELLDLLHALDAELRSIKTVASLDRYLSLAGCTWPENARHQPPAAKLYARLFSEARIRAPGATSPQRRKA